MAKKKIQKPDQLVAKIEADFRKITARAETVMVLSEVRNQVGALLSSVVSLQNKLCYQKNSDEALIKLVGIENELKNLRDRIRSALGVDYLDNRSAKRKKARKRRAKKRAN